MPSSRYSRGTFQRSEALADLRYAAEITKAYDTVAQDYDEAARGDQWMRKVLWRHYERLFGPRQRVLDVGCGTGLDTCYLAERQLRVTGLDLSPKMIEQLTDRAEGLGLGGRVQAQIGDAAELSAWPGGYFHGVISSFGALNTVRDLSGFAEDSARLLLPYGRLVAHMTAPGDTWEHRQRIRRQGREAARLYRHRRHRSKLVGTQALRQRVIYSSEVYQRYFQRHFRLVRRYGLGFLLPRETMKRLPERFVDGLGRVEAELGSLRMFLHRSRYFVLDLEKRTERS